MAKMISQAGEMEVRIERFGAENGNFTVIGKLGVWDSTMYFTPREIMGFLPLLFKMPVLLFFLTVPFRWVGSFFRKS